MGLIRWNNFSAGEIDPKILSREEIERVQSGCRTLVNMWPTAQGSVVKRQGTERLAPVPDMDEKARLIAFKFNVDQQYVLVMNAGRCYPMVDGGFVLEDVDPDLESASTTIEVISSTSVEIDVSATTAGAHGLLVGDLVFFDDMPATNGLPFFEGKIFRVLAVTATTFTLEFSFGDTISLPSTITAPVAATSGVRIRKIYSFAIPYSEAELFDGDLDWAQSANDLYTVHPSHRPRVTTRTADNAWTVTNFDATPTEPAVTGLTASGAPSGTDTIKYGVTAINDDTGEESLVAEVDVASTDEPTDLDPMNLEWDYQSSADKYRVYRAINGIFGLLAEARYVSGSTVTYSDNGSRVPLLETGPPIEVRDSFDSADNYPGAVALYQQRIWFGRTNNNVIGIYSSRSGSFRSFALEEVTVDSSPIAQSIAAEGVHELRYIIAGKDVVLMTAAGEHTFDKADLGIVTPSSGLTGQGDWGCAKVKPLLVGNSIIFVEGSGRMVRDLNYTIQSDGFDGLDLSISSEHMFEERSIVDWCFARRPYRLVFAVLDDGSCVSLTYDKEQQVSGWARHSFSGVVESVCSVREGSVDVIYMTVERSGVGRSIERLPMNEVTSLSKGRYLDSWVERDPTVENRSSQAVLRARVDVDDGDKVKFQIPGTPVYEYWPAQIRFLSEVSAAGFEYLDGESVVLEATTPPTGETGTWFTVNRWIGGEPTWSTLTTNESDMELFPITDPPRRDGLLGKNSATAPFTVYFGSGNFTDIGEFGFAEDPIDNASKTPAMRLDDDFWNPGGEFSSRHLEDLNGDKAYGLAIAGYPYTSEIETREVRAADQVTDGKHVRTPELVLSLHQAGPFEVKRSGASQPAATVETRRDRNYQNRKSWLFESGSIRQSTHSVWDPRSSVIVQSSKPFPLTLSAVTVEAQVSDG